LSGSDAAPIASNAKLRTLQVGCSKRGAALAQLLNASLFGLGSYYVPREPKLSWEIGANILKQHERFSLQLGEKTCGNQISTVDS